MKRPRLRKLRRRLMALDTRKLLGVTLICIAIDSGTAFATSRFAPATFAAHEQNALTRWAFTTGHVEGFLVAEASAVLMAIIVYVLASWTKVTAWKFMAFYVPLLFLYGASTNVVALVVSPSSSLVFFPLVYALTCLILSMFLSRRFLTWVSNGRWGFKR